METDYNRMHEIRFRKEYNRSYKARYVAEIKHLELGLTRILKDMNSKMLRVKVEEQLRAWDEKWARVVAKNKQHAEKVDCQQLTLEAQELQKQIENILLHALEVDSSIDWEKLKVKNKFEIPNPKNKLRKALKAIKTPSPPTLTPLPVEPEKNKFKPVLSFWDRLIKSYGKKKIVQAEDLYQKALTEWRKKVLEVKKSNEEVEQEYKAAQKTFEAQKIEVVAKYNKLEQEWKKVEADFFQGQIDHNRKVESLKSSYLNHESESILEYCELVLNNSQYPDFISNDFDLQYFEESKMLIVEYLLPSPEIFPTLIEVKYISSKNEIRESHLSESQVAKAYDNLVYKISLRTLHELFESDKINAINSIVLNGWVNAINTATGKYVNNCILSLQVKKEEFIELDLARIDPKACFKNLKGIGSSKLSGITAIQPIVQINKNDKRFVSSYDVAHLLNEGLNLASMEWEDFEHLIREIFENEFSLNGGEVKVTQASRDGGVDAVAFDPDPIRGGKIVIQAKRYTNTVGVSAVRDLYGTVMNEGATKGILVTTADYGSDAYEFAKNKPITLMNGANLLYLLEKHGYKARIDIAEAKKNQTENK